MCIRDSISLELGGKSPFIWLPSEDYEPAINQLFGSVFYNSGQTCTALTRLLVPESDLEKVKALLLRRIPQLIVGDPMDPKTNIGPMASKAQYDKVLSYIELGQSEGAELLCGGPPKPAKATSSNQRSLSTSPIPCALRVKKSSVPYFA